MRTIASSLSSQLIALARLTRVATSASGTRLRGLLRGSHRALVQIENTNYCNFHCTYCPTHSPDSAFTVTRGHMSQETFERILDDNPKALLAVIQGQGEPLMDPGLFDKIAAARRRKIVTEVITNGSLLRGAMIDRLCESGPDVLLVSLDASSPETNAKERIGLRFNTVFENVRALTEARSKAKRPMLVGLLSIVHHDYDEEVEEALRRYDALGLDVLLYKQRNRAYEGRIRGYFGAGAVGEVPLRVRARLGYVLSHQRVAPVKPCPQLAYDLPYYLWDGQQTPCCVMNDPRYAAPTVTREQLLDRYAARDLPGECERCSYFAGYDA